MPTDDTHHAPRPAHHAPSLSLTHTSARVPGVCRDGRRSWLLDAVVLRRAQAVEARAYNRGVRLPCLEDIADTADQELGDYTEEEDVELGDEVD